MSYATWFYHHFIHNNNIFLKFSSYVSFFLFPSPQKNKTKETKRRKGKEKEKEKPIQRLANRFYRPAYLIIITTTATKRKRKFEKKKQKKPWRKNSSPPRKFEPGNHRPSSIYSLTRIKSWSAFLFPPTFSSYLPPCLPASLPPSLLPKSDWKLLCKASKVDMSFLFAFPLWNDMKRVRKPKTARNTSTNLDGAIQSDRNSCGVTKRLT